MIEHYQHVIRPIKGLVGYVKNARTHSSQQIEMLAHAIQEFGFTAPLLIDEQNNILAGHCRIDAARKLKMQEVPCIVVSGLSDTQRKAIILADNQLFLKGSGWNTDVLLEELGDLRDSGFDLSLAGFDDADLEALLHGIAPGEGLTDPDDAPEPPRTPTSALGDVWVMGRHRLAAGDCTDPLVVEKALNGVKPHLLVTDPPFGIDFDPEKRGRMLKDHAKRATGRIANDDRADWREAWALFPGDVAYVWHAPTMCGEVKDSLEANDLIVRSQIVWAKSRFAMTPGHYKWMHETCWYAVRKSATAHWAGDKSQTTVWQIDSHGKSESGHSSQKPVECMQRPIENNSSPGQAVYDPFLGSGTSVISCEITGRSCLAIEIDPRWCDVSVRRWQDFVGKDAVLEATGQTFADVAAERHKQ